MDDMYVVKTEKEIMEETIEEMISHGLEKEYIMKKLARISMPIYYLLQFFHLHHIYHACREFVFVKHISDRHLDRTNPLYYDKSKFIPDFSKVLHIIYDTLFLPDFISYEYCSVLNCRERKVSCHGTRYYMFKHFDFVVGQNIHKLRDNPDLVERDTCLVKVVAFVADNHKKFWLLSAYPCSYFDYDLPRTKATDYEKIDFIDNHDFIKKASDDISFGIANRLCSLKYHRSN